MINLAGMPKPLFIFDLDGTLFNHEHCLHPRDKELLLSDHDQVFIPATGRTLSSVRVTFREKGLFPDGNLPLPMITQNGARNYLPGEILDSYFSFEPVLGLRLLDILDQFKQLPLLMMTEDRIHTLHTGTDDPTALWDFNGIPFDRNDPNLSISKFLIYGERPEDLREVEEAVRGLPVEPVYSMPHLFELTPLGVTKAGGVERLAKSLGMQDSPVYAAGDGGNDVPLFEIATRSFAPSSAPLELQKQADQVIDWHESGLLAPMLEWAMDHPA